MKLLYNGIDLVALATHARVLQTATVREPAEAPQRERVAIRLRLDFFEQSWQDNYALIQQVRQALKTQQAVLLWQEDAGGDGEGNPGVYLQRTVTAAEDEAPEERPGNTYWQSLSLSFWYYNHDLVTNCLNASVSTGQVLGGGQPAPPLDMGAVERWEERLAVTRFDELRDPRQRVAGIVTASGRWQADTTQSLEERRSALIAQKNALRAAILKGATVTLSFGDFTQQVRVSEFKADLDQPNNFVAWSLSVTYTCYPNEQNYLLCEIRVAQRENKPEGIPRLVLSGRIGAPTESAARAKLSTLKGALLPPGYVMVSDDSEARTVESDSAPDGVSPLAGDGSAFIELTFNLEYRDSAGLVCTFQRDRANSLLLNLGTVDRFSDRYVSTLFDDLRPNRKRTAGTVTIAGKWYAAESLTDAQKQAALAAKKAAMDTVLSTGITGTLIYGSAAQGTQVFNKLVRCLDFVAEVNRMKNCIEWSLSASFTRFPNEADYALCEFRVVPHENKVEGTALLSLSGKIGAPTAEAAREKLGRLRAQLVPSSYVRIQEQSEENRVDVESGRNSPGGDTGDGATFLELTFNEEYQKTSGNVLTWTLRITNDDDAKSALVHTTYSGSVQASAATIADAFNTAATQAAALGDGKVMADGQSFKLRSQVTENQRLFQTSGGLVFVTVDFSYEYQSKGARVFLEVVSELTQDTFGQNVETVSGHIAAPTLAIAQAAYAADVRGLPSYANALILNERTPTLSRQRLSDGSDHELAKLDDRFAFSFSVLRPKTQTSMAYTIEPDSNVQAMELKTVVRGTVRAASEDVAGAFLDSFLAGLGNLGKLVERSRPAEYQQGPALSGQAPVRVFVALHFTQTYLAQLTGLVNGILECEVTETVQYSGDRLVEKPIPDGLPIIQRCGTVAGRRTVAARAVGTTETSARAWVLKMRSQLLTGTGNPGDEQYEAPPQVSTVFRFLVQTDGTPRGAAANVRLYECAGNFTELLPDYALST